MYFNQKREKSRKNKEETTTGDKPLNTRRKKINSNYLDKPTNYVNIIKKVTKIILKKIIKKEKKNKKNHVLKREKKKKERDTVAIHNILQGKLLCFPHML